MTAHPAEPAPSTRTGQAAGSEPTVHATAAGQADVREGTPIWADAMFADLAGAKSYYAEVLGWTFGEASTEYGNYTQAYAEGKAAAAVVPPMPGAEDFSAWCLYLASPDAAATAEKIRRNGGQLLMEPMTVGDFGTMALAREPSGVVFGVWQPGTHRGFDARPPMRGAYCWAEVFTREPERADAFFQAVFGYRQQRMDDPGGDFRLYNLGEDTVLGRMSISGEDFPPEMPPYLNVYFTVDDVDRACARTRELGGSVYYGPMDSPFGRFAALGDPMGAAFSVIDIHTVKGEMPRMEDVS